MASLGHELEPEQLLRIIDSIPALIHTAKPDGYFDYFNQRWLDYVGLPIGELLGWKWTAAIHPEDVEALVAKLRSSIASGEHFLLEARVRRADGEYRWMLHHKVAVRDESGEIVKWYGSSIDIEDRRRADIKIREQEAELRKILDLTPQNIAVLGPDGIPLYVNHMGLEYFGMSLDQWRDTRSRLNRVHPDDREHFVTERTKGLLKREPYELEARLQRHDGHFRWHLFRFNPVKDERGHVTRWYSATIDIEDRKQAEYKIRRLVDANILGIFIWTLEGAIVEANQAFLRMVQYSSEDLVSGRVRWTDLTPAEWRERDERALIELSGTGTVQPYEKEYLRKDGSRVPVLIGGATFQERGNEGVAFVLDLSEQKRAEEALRSSEAYLAEAQRLSHTGSWAWNAATGEPGYWSEECYRVLGFDPAEPLPLLETFFQRIQPDDHRAAVREQFERAIREKADLELDLSFVHPSTGNRNIRSISHAVLDHCGDLREIVGTVIDITERKAAEEKIREHEMELRQVLDFAPQQVVVFGPGGERLYANRVALDYLGVSLEEWRKRSNRGEFFHPDDRERIKDVIDRALATGSAFEVEMRIRKGDGSYRWFLGRYNPLRDDKGQITRWYAAGADIDDRKRAEEKLQLENAALREEIDQTSMFEEIVGTSRPLQTVLSCISKVAPTDSTVLITGETGTGKELVARAIHRRSQRSGGAFVSVNCAAIPRDLIFSELFGHEKGAFTGATRRRLGRFEMAEGGTIFLDEVGELLPDTQVALLRVLQEREFERVGGGQPVRVDVRVIAATNRDLEAAVANGTFRQDLFYRLNVFPIEVPPLRERKEDILMLVEYFVQRYAARAGKHLESIDKRALELLQSYEWRGNIRELQNVIERSVILSSGDVLTVEGSWLSNESLMRASRVQSPAPFNVETEPPSEREIIEAALAASRGRVSGPLGAAAKLAMPTSTLNHRIKALKINKKFFKYR